MIAAVRRQKAEGGGQVDQTIFNWLTSCPANDINFKVKLERANSATVAEALQFAERHPEGNKSRLQKLRAQYNRLQKQEQKASPGGDFRTGDQTFTIGQQVCFKSHPKPDWIGKTGTIVQIEHGKGKPEAQVALVTGSKTWAAFQWLEAVELPGIEEAIAPCEEGDYVRGQNLKDGSWIEGEATAIGRKYVQLDHASSKAILIETLEILRPIIPEPPEEQESAFKVGDRVLIHQEGHPDLHGRISRLNSDGETVVFVDEFDAATTVSVEYLFPEALNDGEIALTHPPDPLSDLATQINELHSQSCEAEATALAAGRAALQLRKEEGDRLLEAKAQVKHGQWGKWLKANCPGISERSCQLYMQLAEGWDYIAKNETVAELTLRDAIKLLPKRTKTAEQPPTPSALDYTPLPEPKPCWFKVGESWTEGQAIATNQRGMTHIIWGEDRECDVPGDRVQWSAPAQETAVSAETRASLAAAGLAICTPSITPAEFNREMWGDKPPTVSYTPTVAPPVTCQLCRHRTPIDGVEQDRYWCEQGEFNDTLPLTYDYAKDANEGICKSFEAGQLPPQQPAALPEPETPIVRLKVKRGKGKGVEIVSAIVQIGGVTHYLQVEDLALEDF